MDEEDARGSRTPFGDTSNRKGEGPGLGRRAASRPLSLAASLAMLRADPNTLPASK